MALAHRKEIYHAPPQLLDDFAQALARLRGALATPVQDAKELLATLRREA